MGTTSPAATVVVTNSGRETLSISLISSSLAEFIVIIPAMPIKLGPKGSASFQVMFQPEAALTYSGSIVLHEGHRGGGTQTISVSGQGFLSTYLLQANPNNVNFNNTLVGTSASQGLALQNNGQGPVNVSQVVITGAGFAVSGFSGNVTLAPGQNFPLTVSFAPASAGSATGSLSVISSATNSPNAISLSGTSIQPQISGSISGAGGNGATVTLSGAASASTTANSSGNYTFSGLANGSYTVTPSKAGYTFAPTSENLTVNGANVTATTFTATAVTYTISGSISGAGGNGATVTLSGAASASTTANSSGNYTFSGLANGTYAVTPAQTGYTFSPSSQAATINGANVTATTFTATAVTYTISGSISGAGGNGATVTLSGAASASTTANSSGNYTFSGLANGTYTVTPSKAGYTFRSPRSAKR